MGKTEVPKEVVLRGRNSAYESLCTTLQISEPKSTPIPLSRKIYPGHLFKKEYQLKRHIGDVSIVPATMNGLAPTAFKSISSVDDEQSKGDSEAKFLAADFSSRVMDLCARRLSKYRWGLNRSRARWSLNREARKWIDNNTTENHPLRVAPLDELDSLTHLVFFIQQLAIFRGETAEVTLQSINWPPAHIIRLSRVEPAYIVSVASFSEAYIRRYPLHSQRREFRSWFQSWEDIFGLLRSGEHSIQNADEFFASQFVRTNKVTDILKKYSRNYQPLMRSFKEYSLFDAYELEYFFEELKTNLGSRAIVLPDATSNPTLFLTSLSDKTEGENSGWYILRLLAMAACHKNSEVKSDLYGYLNCLLQLTNNSVLPLDLLQAIGAPASIRRAYPKEAKQISLWIPEFFETWSELIEYPEGLAPALKTHFLTRLRQLSGRDNLGRRAMQRIVQALGRRLRPAEIPFLLQVVVDAKNDIPKDSSLDAKELHLNTYIAGFVEQIEQLQSNSPDLIQHYLIQDLQLVAMNLKLATQIVKGTVREDEITAFFEEHDSGLFPRNNKTAYHHELSFAQAISGEHLSPGAKLRIWYLYSVLQTKDFRRFYKKGVRMMRRTADMGEAGGSIYFDAHEKKGIQLGTKSYVKLTEAFAQSGSEAAFHDSDYNHASHLHFHYHEVDSLDGYVGSTTGPTGVYPRAGGLRSDAGLVLMKGEYCLVFTVIRNSKINIDYYDHTGVVVDLGVYRL